jgi:radical SAM-linked protein
LSFGLALPTGCESIGEYLDVRLEAPAPAEPGLDDLPTLMTELLPEGIDVQVAAMVGWSGGSLQQEVGSCDWDVEVLGVHGEELEERVERLLAAPALVVRRERKGRPVDDDIRPAILSLSVADPDGRLRAELATHPRGVRPGDMIAALGAGAPGRLCRTHQWIERDGARFEPLPLAGGLGTAAATQYARRVLPHVRDGCSPGPGGSRRGGVDQP